MAEGKINGIAAAAVATGLVFIWSGIKGASVLKTVGALVRGEKPEGRNEYPVSTPMGGEQQGQAPAASSDAAGGTAAANKAIAKQLAASYGWSEGAEWDALVKLWEHESSWNNKAENRSSHAYGIPQSLPWTKMPKAAWPERAGGSSNAGAQITWGLKYIKGRYGSPAKAWADWQRKGWY